VNVCILQRISETKTNKEKTQKSSKEVMMDAGRRLLWAELLYAQTWSLNMRKEGGKARSFIIEEVWWGITARQVKCSE
jgi:hypothetical protein